jgi:hypothetical protein
MLYIEILNKIDFHPVLIDIEKNKFLKEGLLCYQGIR